MVPASPYLGRVVDDELDSLVPSLPAIALEGAKGVGKTATAIRRAHSVRTLDDPAIREIIGADPSRVVSGDLPILIDEWQRVPESWDLVRRAVDDGAPPGSFLLTGSATPAAGTHSGAGRIVRLRMRPMTLAERGCATPSVGLSGLLRGDRPAIEGQCSFSLENYASEICGSGFPGLRTFEGRALRAHLDGYLDRIIDRDFAEMGLPIRNPAGLRRWMTAYAAATATGASYETIRDAATAGEHEKPAKTTVIPYRDILERLWVLDPVPAWLPTKNHIARLAAAPKHHLADPALAARLLGADVPALIEGRPLGPSVARDTTLLGQLFESLAALSVRVFAQAAEATVGHLRTHGGDHEIDLIVERGDHRVVAIEAKLARTADERSVRHLNWLRDRIGDDLLDAVVITTGRDAYRRSDGIAVVPLALLGA
ncbi:MAG: ATP-binding protein [Acidobacteria bacterium]|nr:ATP-binding protein [Acidobacteriota bacterium]